MRSDNPADPPIIFTEPYIIIGEGDGDVSFFKKLIEKYGIENVNATCPQQARLGSGRDSISNTLHTLKTGIAHRPTTALKGVAIAVDNDDDPAKTFAQAQEWLRTENLPVPEGPYQIVREGIATAIMLIPREGEPGNLESLLLEAVLQKRPELRECVDSFAGCVKHPLEWSSNKQAKMRLMSLIAACCKDDPCTSISNVFHKQDNPIPIDSDRFSHIVNFLKEFSNAPEQEVSA